MKRIVAYVFMLMLIFSCGDSKQKVAPKQPERFQIEGAREQVVKTHADGTPKVSYFFDEKSNSKIAEVEFHPNGQPKIDLRFANDQRNGESWCYYEDGKPWSLNTFKDGVNDGPYKTWHENGQLYIQGQYASGKETGEWYTYYANGALNTRGFYDNGQKIGVWYSYNLEGTMKREQDFGVAKPSLP
jgi:antitoxin component YwqK of YwqJK toxin-antitoxin module